MFQDYLNELSKVKLLSEDKERYLWQSYKEAGDMDARALLIESYQPLVFKLVMKMQPKEDILLDVLQEGHVGLIEAVERYNHTKGIHFPTYASFRIRGQVINYLQKIQTHTVSLDFRPGSEEESPTLENLLSHQVSKDSFFEERIMWQEPLQQALGRLPEKERKVIKAVYLEDQDPQKIAIELQISLPHLYRLQKKGLRRIRGMLSRLKHDLKT